MNNQIKKKIIIFDKGMLILDNNLYILDKIIEKRVLAQDDVTCRRFHKVEPKLNGFGSKLIE